MEFEAARFRGPVTGNTTAIAITTVGGDTDLSALPGFAGFFDSAGGGKGKYIAFISSQAVQLAFGPTTVTIGANDPQFPAGVVQSFLAEGAHLGWKAAVNGTLYVWPAS